MKRLQVFVALLSIVWMSTVVNAQDLGLKEIPNWLKFPPKEHPDWTWEQVVGVDFDSKGNLYISSRRGTAPPLTVWKPDGTLLRVFPGPKVNSWDHYVEIDREHDDIVWWAIEGDNVVYKMDQDGKVLLTLGTLGKDFANTENPSHFSGVSDVAWDADGNLYVSDGARKIFCRVHKYDKDGNHIKTWGGEEGQGHLQFNYPHSIFVTDDQRVIVPDRNNGRVHVYDLDGNFIEYWNHFEKPYQIRESKYGEFFVSEGTTDRIDKIDIKTGEILGWQKGGFNNAHSFAICPITGDMLCGMMQGSVKRFTMPIEK